MWAQQQPHQQGPMGGDAQDLVKGAELFRVGNEIHFSAGISFNTMQSLVKLLKEVEAEALAAQKVAKAKVALSDKEADLVEVKVEAKPILLFITSYGGLVRVAMSAVDAIERLKVPVHTVVSGYAASAGTLLSMAGAKRFITPHSYMMIHEIRSGFWGKHSDARVECENMDKIMAMITRYYAKRTKLPEEELRTALSKDRDWDAEECIKHGLADEVLPPART